MLPPDTGACEIGKSIPHDGQRQKPARARLAAHFGFEATSGLATIPIDWYNSR